MRPIHRSASVAAAILLLGATTTAQQTLDAFSLGAPAGAEPTLVAVGDLDGDDVIDFVVGEPHDDALGPDTGSVTARAGAGGGLLFRVDGGASGALFGLAIDGVGDLDDDGHDDFAVGAPGANTVALLSGADGSVLRTIAIGSGGDAFGHALGPVADLDQDGELDLLVGAPGDDGAGTDAGTLYVVSSGTGFVLDAFAGHSAGARAGSLVGTHALGPWSMDLEPLPTVDATWGGDASSGHVDGLDFGAAPACLTSVPSLVNVGLLGDVDGDGTPDVLVATVDATAQHGVARIVSGDDGATLVSVASDDAQTGLGRAFAVIEDVDGDGARDLALGEPDALSGRGRVLVVSSSDGRVVHRIDGPASGTGFGRSLALVGDYDLDGDGELAVGATTGPSGGRRVTIISLRSANQSLLANGEISLRATVEGTLVQLSLRDAPADAPVAVAVGTSLVVDAASGALRATSELVVGTLVTDSDGSLDATTPLPVALAGEPLYFEAFVENAGSLDTTAPVPAEEVAL